MNILAFDTSLDACAVAVATDGAPPVIVTEIVGRIHGERLIGLIDEALAAAGLAMGGIERIAVAVGPGSFTGLRIAVAAARGLALVTEAPAVGVSNLAIHAARARSLAGETPVLVATTAGRGDVYAQVFAADGEPLGDPVAAPPAAVAGMLAADMRIAGSAAGLVAEAAGADAERIVHDDAAPDMATLCRLVPDAGAEPPRPLYIRRPDAKPQSGAAVARA